MINALCDRCKQVISMKTSKQIEFLGSSSLPREIYDLCPECCEHIKNLIINNNGN